MQIKLQQYGFIAAVALATACFAFVVSSLLQRLLPKTGPGEIVATNRLIEIRDAETGGATRNTGVESKFEIKNIGHTSVHITSLQSSCGCSTPSIDGDWVEPGQTVNVIVLATPPAVGERLATLSLSTDSPKTPLIELGIRLLGSHKPPFLLDARGDLIFQDGPDRPTYRGLEVTTIEVTPGQIRPVPSSHFPGLSIEYVSSSESPYNNTNAFQRIDKYRAKLDWGKIENTSSGEVEIPDPWVPGNSKRLTVLARTVPRVRIIPPRIEISPTGDPGSSSVVFIVVSHKPNSKWTVSPDKTLPTGLVVEPVETKNAGLMTKFRVRALGFEAVPASGQYDLVIRSDDKELPEQHATIIVNRGRR